MLIVGAAEISQPSPEQTNLVILFHFVKFFAVLLIIGALVGSIYLNNRRRCRETDELLEELEQDRASPAESAVAEDDKWEKRPGLVEK